MIPNWLKNEDTIYNKFKNAFDDIRKNYYQFLETSTMDRLDYLVYPQNWYINMPPGIETNNDNLKPISIVITNWERYYYIPLVFEMWYAQDYPRNLLEFLIVDDDSVDKTTLLNIIKEQTKLYPDLKIRFIQNYKNKTQGSVGRINIAIRHSYHNIVIMNETDMIPLGRNYLRGICYAHNKFPNVTCIPIAVGIMNRGDEEFHLDDLGQIFNNDETYGMVSRLDHQYVASFNKELFSKIHGFDERIIGWGGHERNIIERYASIGGRLNVNTSIYAGSLPNFPRALPHGLIKRHGGGSWQKGIIINDENWGISEKMEEINLYQ